MNTTPSHHQGGDYGGQERGGGSTPGAASDSTAGGARATIRIRNVRESVVYHLLFDGDIGKLTGAQLKTHINAICGVPTDHQLLTYNGQPLHNSSTGYMVDLQTGGMLLMDYVDRGGGGANNKGGRPTPAHSESDSYAPSHNSRPTLGGEGGGGGGGGVIPPPSPSMGPSSSRGSPPQHKQHTPSVAQHTNNQSYNPNTQSQHNHLHNHRHQNNVSVQEGLGSPGQDLNHLEHEIERIRREEEEILRRQDELRRGRSAVSYGSGHAAGSNNAGGHNPSTYPSYAVTGLNDEIDVDVEVIEEDDRVAWHPTSSVDVEETRTLQQDYVWKMEQVRFETERMNRQREMRRQQQELEYAAELLDRERVELERRTHMERNKFEAVQRQLADDMTIEARFVPATTYQ